MTEEQKEKLRKLLYQLKYITDSEEKDPFVGIYFSDLIDLLEDYKLNRLWTLNNFIHFGVMNSIQH